MPTSLRLLSNIVFKKSRIASYAYSMHGLSAETIISVQEMIDAITVLCKEAEQVETPKAMTLETLKKYCRSEF